MDLNENNNMYMKNIWLNMYDISNFSNVHKGPFLQMNMLLQTIVHQFEKLASSINVSRQCTCGKLSTVPEKRNESLNESVLDETLQPTSPLSIPETENACESMEIVTIISDDDTIKNTPQKANRRMKIPQRNITPKRKQGKRSTLTNNRDVSINSPRSFKNYNAVKQMEVSPKLRVRHRNTPLKHIKRRLPIDEKSGLEIPKTGVDNVLGSPDFFAELDNTMLDRTHRTDNKHSRIDKCVQISVNDMSVRNKENIKDNYSLHVESAIEIRKLPLTPTSQNIPSSTPNLGETTFFAGHQTYYVPPEDVPEMINKSTGQTILVDLSCKIPTKTVSICNETSSDNDSDATVFEPVSAKNINQVDSGEGVQPDIKARALTADSDETIFEPISKNTIHQSIVSGNVKSTYKSLSLKKSIASGKCTGTAENEVSTNSAALGLFIDELGQVIDDNVKVNKKPVDLMSSYDQVPQLSKDPEYEYRRGAVRKKNERMQLEGWDCYQCKKYYEYLGDPTLAKSRMNACSRHRDKYEIPSTPKGFWNPVFTQTQK